MRIWKLNKESTDVTVNPEASPVVFCELGAIPKTPLQRYLNQQPKPIISSPTQNKKITCLALQQHALLFSSPQAATGAGINVKQ